MTRDELLHVALLQATEEGVGIHLAKFADMCIEWGQQHPHWISVEEIQPKEDEWFLGYSPLKSPLSSMKIDVYNFNSNGLIEAHGITHWMPLPLPPKEGGQTL